MRILNNVVLVTRDYLNIVVQNNLACNLKTWIKYKFLVLSIQMYITIILKYHDLATKICCKIQNLKYGYKISI